jgi:hypothetical protein
MFLAILITDKSFYFVMDHSNYDYILHVDPFPNLTFFYPSKRSENEQGE